MFFKKKEISSGHAKRSLEKPAVTFLLKGRLFLRNVQRRHIMFNLSRKKTFSADCTSEHLECSFDITYKTFPPESRKKSSEFTTMMKNGNFLAKNFNESFHRNIWNAVLTSLLKFLTTETETLWLKVRRWKKSSQRLFPQNVPLDL